MIAGIRASTSQERIGGISPTINAHVTGYAEKFNGASRSEELTVLKISIVLEALRRYAKNCTNIVIHSNDANLCAALNQTSESTKILSKIGDPNDIVLTTEFKTTKESELLASAERSARIHKHKNSDRPWRTALRNHPDSTPQQIAAALG
jgi:hypothetical protein